MTGKLHCVSQVGVWELEKMLYVMTGRNMFSVGEYAVYDPRIKTHLRTSFPAGPKSQC